MNRLITKESIREELASATKLLAKTRSTDVLGRLSLQGKIKELEQELEKVQAKWKKSAEVILYFGGNPVLGSSSIRASFATAALDSYQELISTLYASKRQKDFSENGRIPLLSESQLNIAGTPRGSFGFILLEESEQENLIDSDLSNIIEDANTLLAISNEDSDDDADDTIATVHPRVLSSLKKFINTLASNNASLDIKTEKTNLSLNSQKIKKCSEYIESIDEIITKHISLEGTFKGATALRRGFDFIPKDSKHGPKISGTISKDIEERFIATMNTTYMDVECIADLKLIETKKTNAQKTTQRWTLLDIRPAPLQKIV